MLNRSNGHFREHFGLKTISSNKQGMFALLVVSFTDTTLKGSTFFTKIS